MTKFTQKHK